MRRGKRWWRVAFFLLLVGSGVVRVAFEGGELWWIVPTIVGAVGLVWVMWDDQREHRERQRERQDERRRADRRHQHMLRLIRGLLEEQFRGDPDAEQKIDRRMVEYTARLAISTDLGGPTSSLRLRARPADSGPKTDDSAKSPPG